VTLRVRLRDAGPRELLVGSLPSGGWFLAERDATFAEPSRLIDLVAGYLRFSGRAMAAAS
jgi:hypothetical protein